LVKYERLDLLFLEPIKARLKQAADEKNTLTTAFGLLFTVKKLEIDSSWSAALIHFPRLTEEIHVILLQDENQKRRRHVRKIGVVICLP